MTRPINFTDYSDKINVASSISGFWDSYNSRRAKAMAKWKEIDLYRYATDTKDLPGADNFDHNVHIPITHIVDEKLKSILNATAFPHEDWLGWEASDFEAENVEKRNRVLSYINKVHSLTKFTREGKKALADLVAYGNNFLQTVHVNESSEEGGKIVEGYVGPKTYRISPYDIVFDPTSPSFEESFKVIRKKMTVGEFALFAEKHSDLVDPEVVRNILSRRIGSSDSATTNNQYKDAQYVPEGFDSLDGYYMSGYVHVLWFYGSIFDEATLKVIPNRCILVADYNKIVFDKHDPDPKIRKGGWKERPDNLWSQSPLEPIIGLNYEINHRENAKNDAIDKFIHPDELYIGDPEIIHDDVTGRREIWAPINGSAQDITPDASTLSFNTEIDKLTMTVMQVVGIPPDVIGFRSPGEKTAFEVQNLNDGAFRDFVDHVAQWEQDCLEKVIGDQISVGRAHFNGSTVTVNSPEGIPLSAAVSKEDLKVNAVVVPQGARRFARMLQQLAGIQSMAQTLQFYQSHVDSYNLAKAIETLSGLDEFGIIKKFAAIEEQGGAEKASAAVEQDLVESLSQPTAREMSLPE